MTTSSLRIFAAGIALIFAVLTGLFTGMAAAGPQQCGTSGESPNQTPGQNQNEATPGTGRRGGNPGGDQKTVQPKPPGQTPPGENTQPGPGGGLPGGRNTEGGLNTAGSNRRPLAVGTAEDCSGGFSGPAAAVGFLGALLAGAAVTALLFVRRRDAAPAPAAAVSDGSNGHADGDRTTLVQNVIYVRDRVTSKALADRLGWALQEVGVTTVAPTGQKFDPAHHEAGGSATTNDPSKVGTIAAVEVPGYLDRGAVLRAPVVTVYRQDGK
jgi:hypothetical protein